MRRHSSRSTHALIVAYVALGLVLFNFLFGIRAFGQNNFAALKYDSIKVVTPTDTTKHSLPTYFYFNDCSLIIISLSTRVYDILIPSINNFDVTGIRVLQDTGVQMDDKGVIYESPLHKKQLAVYFSVGMETLTIMRKDKTGIIFY